MPNFLFRRPGARRAVAAVVALGAAATLVGCGPRQPTPRELAGDRLLVLTTFTVVADMARVVGGEDVYVESITKVGAEIHGYEPTPDDLRRAADADLILENGLGLEAWFADFTARLDVPHATISAGVETIPIAGEDGTEPREGAPVNPHAWMSPTVGAQYALNIGRALAEADPENAVEYESRAHAYADELIALAETLTLSLATIPEEARVLATCEGAFSYLARDAGLAEVYLWPVNAEQQATPHRLEDAIDAIRARDVPAVFCESTVSANAQKQVARESGAHYGGALYVDSLSDADGPVPTYLDLLRYDARLVVDGLTRATTDDPTTEGT
jgi:manganese transport system substrate-binding protein